MTGSRRRQGLIELGVLVATAMALAGCASKAPLPLVVSGETVLIRGSISDKTAEEFKRTLGERPISRVLLDSGGGLVEPALTIATEIRQRRIDVEVVGNCFSSCANYLFPAGATRRISGLGVVAWHGNMGHLLHLHATGAKPLDAETLAEVQRLARLENRFFSSIGLDPFIGWFAKLPPYQVRNLYFLSPADMARFGLTDVIVRADYTETDVSSHNREGVVNLQYVEVDWDRLERPPALP